MNQSDTQESMNQRNSEESIGIDRSGHLTIKSWYNEESII